MIANKTIAFTVFLLNGCAHFNPQVSVPKPSIMEIKPEFRTIEFKKTSDNGLIFDFKNGQNLMYNIKMSRVYFNQLSQNLSIISDYYESINQT